MINPYDDGISIDTFVDWLDDAGYQIARVPDYFEWLSRFETSLRSLPDKQRQASLLPLLHNYQKAGAPDQRIDRADRQVPCGGSERKDRPRQGHPACHRAGNPQVRH